MCVDRYVTKLYFNQKSPLKYILVTLMICALEDCYLTLIYTMGCTKKYWIGTTNTF